MSVAYDSPLEVAKERLSIPDLWRLLNLPGKPGRSCRSPFREIVTRVFRSMTAVEGGMIMLPAKAETLLTSWHGP